MLYLAAYDIAQPRRLQKALEVLKGYSTGGQKSVFECFLTPGELKQLTAEALSVLDLDEDRFLVVPVSTHPPVRTLGIAIQPEDPEFFYFG